MTALRMTALRMTALRRTHGYGAERISVKGGQQLPPWLRTLLAIPLEVKLLGANVIILGVAVLVLFAPAHLQAGR